MTLPLLSGRGTLVLMPSVRCRAAEVLLGEVRDEAHFGVRGDKVSDEVFRMLCFTFLRLDLFLAFPLFRIDGLLLNQSSSSMTELSGPRVKEHGSAEVCA